jgi:hypothetical protein
MQDEQLEDLKQFIGATVSQAEERLRGEIKDSLGETEERLRDEISRVDGKIDRLGEEMQGGFAGVGEAIDALHQQIEDRDRAVEQRLTKLEGQAV